MTVDELHRPAADASTRRARLSGYALSACQFHYNMRWLEQFVTENICTTASKGDAVNITTSSLYPRDETCEMNFGAVRTLSQNSKIVGIRKALKVQTTYEDEC